jgi:hypothetical protein
MPRRIPVKSCLDFPALNSPNTTIRVDELMKSSTACAMRRALSVAPRLNNSVIFCLPQTFRCAARHDGSERELRPNDLPQGHGRLPLPLGSDLFAQVVRIGCRHRRYAGHRDISGNSQCARQRCSGLAWLSSYQGSGGLIPITGHFISQCCRVLWTRGRRMERAGRSPIPD